MVFAIHKHESVTGIHVSLPSWTALSYPSPPHAPGCHTAPALGSVGHMSDSHWLSILHVVIHMLQCYSFKSSHPLLLPLCPHVGSPCLCLYSCSANRIISTIFLGSITYALIYDICFSLSDWLHSVIGSRFIHLISTDSNVFLFMAE